MRKHVLSVMLALSIGATASAQSPQAAAPTIDPAWKVPEVVAWTSSYIASRNPSDGRFVPVANPPLPLPRSGVILVFDGRHLWDFRLGASQISAELDRDSELGQAWVLQQQEKEDAKLRRGPRYEVFGY